MDFDKEDDNILMLLVASGVANLLGILPKSRRQLVLGYTWVGLFFNLISYGKINNLEG